MFPVLPLIFLILVPLPCCNSGEIIDFPPRLGFARIKRHANGNPDMDPWTVETIIAVAGLAIIIATVLIAATCYKCSQFWEEIREEQRQRAAIADDKYDTPPPSYS